MTTNAGLNLTNEVVGSYRVLTRLGAGGMGEVWSAEHILLGQRVALKFLLPHLSGQTEAVERFFGEARAAARVADPGLVKIHDFGRQQGRAFIVMEFLEGESLFARIHNRGPLPGAYAFRLIQQVAMTMAAVHDTGIIHRDLKPENLFIVADSAVSGGERIKILDFGIAKLMATDDRNHTRTQTGAIMGTPLYMSPEQCRGGGAQIDHRSDIYALGCVLYHMLSGRPPFASVGTGELIARHLMEVPVPPSHWCTSAAASDAVVMRCLEKLPDDRFSSMTALSEALEQLIMSAAEPSTHPKAISSAMNEFVAARTEAARSDAIRAPASKSRNRRLVMVPLIGIAAGFAIFTLARSGPSRRVQNMLQVDASTITPTDTSNTSTPAVRDQSAISDAAQHIDAPEKIDAPGKKPNHETHPRPRPRAHNEDAYQNP